MKYKAFTLVELVVVIAILGILSTVGFISYFGYSENTRDSARVANITRLDKSLELSKTKAGEYPAPDNSSDVTYLGKTIWTQGVIGTKTKKKLKFEAEGLDPKYDIDYSYSVTSDGKRFEIGTILENDENYFIGQLLGTTFAANNEKAFNHGNFKTKFYSTKISGETHVFSLPGLILNNTESYELVVDEATDKFSITGETALPESYVGVAEDESSVNTTFTPRLLYRGDNCGVQTDQEIVNFIANLRDSFNSEPYLSNSQYDSIFENYDILRNNLDDFDVLSEMGAQINESLNCNIKNFKTTDIFPTQCGYENLNFEAVTNGFDIGTQSCLFDYDGLGGATVVSGEGKDGTQGLVVDPGETNKTLSTLKYRVFSYVPMKFNYDMITDFDRFSEVRFYINDVEYLYGAVEGGGEYWNDAYETFTTPLLAPGLYDFRWEVEKNANWVSTITLDNLSFSCIGGGGTCGWEENSFENGARNPWDLFEFNGTIKSTWFQVTGAGNTSGADDSYAIRNPNTNVNGSDNAWISMEKTLDTPQKMSFDIKASLGLNAKAYFYINDSVYLDIKYDDTYYTDDFGKFVTPMLPAGDYTFKWFVNPSGRSQSYITLDNIEYSCENGIGTDTLGNSCGWERGTFEKGNEYPWDIFDFTGAVQTPWLQVTGSGNTAGADNSYAITNPSVYTVGYTYPIANTGNMSFTETFTEPKKLAFDLKTLLGENPAIIFYINDAQYLYITSDNDLYDVYGNKFGHYETPLLPVGDYTFKWKVKGASARTAQMWLDNLEYTCIGGGTDCAYDTNMEDSTGGLNPFEFTGTVETPWFQDTTPGNFTEGSSSLRNPKPDANGIAYMTLTGTLATDQQMTFDYKVDIPQHSWMAFYIDGTEYSYWSHTSPLEDGNFHSFTTPILPAGEHVFKWAARKQSGGSAFFWVDNIRYDDCVGSCGYDNSTFEPSEQMPWDKLEYSGSITTPWHNVTGSGNTYGDTGYAIKSPNPSTYTTSYLTYPNIVSDGTKKVSFDMKTDVRYSSEIYVVIDGDYSSLFLDLDKYNNTNAGFTHYETPVLSAGTHQIDWVIKRRGSSELAYMWLDNLITE